MLCIRIEDDDAGEAMNADQQPRYTVRMQSMITVEHGDDERRYTVTHDVSRFADGSWKVAVNRNGRQTEMSGDGAVPALVDADGAVVIFVPLDAQNPQPSPTASS